MSDPVNHPAHYAEDGPLHTVCGEPIECIDVARTFDFALGNTLKYLWRAGKKGDRLEDLLKSQWYLADAIKQERLRRLEESEHNVNCSPWCEGDHAP